MDKISKAILFGGKAIVSVMDCRELADHAIKLHKSAPAASEALCRMLSLTAFMSAGLKGMSIKLSITVDGDGKFGKIITCGSSGGIVRGYIGNPHADVALRSDGRNDIQDGIGKSGTITVIKDFGMKEPYVGKSELLRGDIDSDFAYYFTSSEQLPSAVASGCVLDEGGKNVIACGAIVVQPMPNCPEEIIVVLEDIVSNFTDFGQMLLERGAEEILDFYFGHFECSILPTMNPRYECICSQERMDNIVKSLGSTEAYNIIAEQGEVEIHCDFCNKYYRYTGKMIDKIFDKKAARHK